MGIHKPESVQDNEMNEILWDIEIQMDQLNLALRPDVTLINKK